MDWLAHQREFQQASPLSIIWFESFDTFPRFSVGTLNIVCEQRIIFVTRLLQYNARFVIAKCTLNLQLCLKNGC